MAAAKKKVAKSARKVAKRRVMSEMGRVNISRAAKKRWSEFRKAKKAAAVK